MIKPYNSEVLQPLHVQNQSHRKFLIDQAQRIPSIIVSSAAAANAVMLGGGYFTPLKGYMGLADVLNVSEKMCLSSGLFWPTPVVNMVREDSLTEEIKSASKIALLDPNVEGCPVIAVQSVDKIETITGQQVSEITEQVYGTTDSRHPGVEAFSGAGNTLISGDIEVLNYSYFETEFPDTFRTAVEIRDEIKKRGWETVIAFQTRNPMHRAHEELCRIAQKQLSADGILVHMLLGKLKEGDIPADIRNASIRKMVELYFPENTVMVTGYGFDMLYAGPREALLHAIFRQNAGCSHLIVGRDHAGVGDYYGAFDSQTIFDSIPEETLQIEIFRGDHTVWCFKCEEVVMMRDCPHDKEDYLLLSGTRVREILSEGKELPHEFSRPEVAKILSEYYQTL